jgi:hypothetical protein
MWPTDNQFALSADKGVIDAAIQQRPRHQRLAPGALSVAAAPHQPVAGLQAHGPVRPPEGAGHPGAARLEYRRVHRPRPRPGAQPARADDADGVDGRQPRCRRPGAGSAGLRCNVAADGLDSASLANDGKPVDASIAQAALPAVMQTVERHLKPIKQAFDADCRSRLGLELAKLKALQDKHLTQLELDFSRGIEQVNAARRKQRESDTVDLFKTLPAVDPGHARVGRPRPVHRCCVDSRIA